MLLCPLFSSNIFERNLSIFGINDGLHVSHLTYDHAFHLIRSWLLIKSLRYCTFWWRPLCNIYNRLSSYLTQLISGMREYVDTLRDRMARTLPKVLPNIANLAFLRNIRCVCHYIFGIKDLPLKLMPCDGNFPCDGMARNAICWWWPCQVASTRGLRCVAKCSTADNTWCGTKRVVV